jgi:hypothetical protein
MSKMAKERLFTTTFKSITSEERDLELKRDVQIFNQQVVKKQSVVNKLEKCYVGKPRKVVVAILFPQEIKREDEEPTKDGKQQKNRGLSPIRDDGKWSKKIKSHTIWFQPHLWPPIAVAIKKHGNNFGVLHFLITTFKTPNMQSPYEKLSRACL